MRFIRNQEVIEFPQGFAFQEPAYRPCGKLIDQQLKVEGRSDPQRDDILWLKKSEVSGVPTQEVKWNRLRGEIQTFVYPPQGVRSQAQRDRSDRDDQ